MKSAMRRVDVCSRCALRLPEDFAIFELNKESRQKRLDLTKQAEDNFLCDSREYDCC